eukprot:SAG22_NODE_130_length_18670_cov_12.091379_19_plen_77_part_00
MRTKALPFCCASTVFLSKTVPFRAVPLAGFAKFQLPDELLVWDAIPMTSTGKMSKKDARDKMTAEDYQLPDLRAKM